MPDLTVTAACGFIAFGFITGAMVTERLWWLLHGRPLPRPWRAVWRAYRGRPGRLRAHPQPRHHAVSECEWSPRLPPGAAPHDGHARGGHGGVSTAVTSARSSARSAPSKAASRLLMSSTYSLWRYLAPGSLWRDVARLLETGRLT